MDEIQLESRFNIEDYEKLQSLFLGASGSAQSLSRTDFIQQAWSSIGRGSKEEYGLLFDSVVVTQEQRGLLVDSTDPNKQKRMDWEGLSSFLLLELSEKEEHDRTSIVPRWRPPQTLTAPHRDPIQQVLYLSSTARYLSVSKGGLLGLWGGEDLGLLQTHRLQNHSVKPKDLWVTSMVLLTNIHKIAVSFTSKEVCFYDLLSKQEYSCQYKLQGLKYAPLCLDYWADPTHPDRAVLSIGDTGGRLSAICFRSAQISLFERPSPGAETEATDIIKWEELTQGRHRCCYTLAHRAHGQAWVRRVRFLGSLEAFASCSTSPQSSMVIGWREREGIPLRVTRFHTEKGVNDLDYHPGLNLIATAGADSQVLLWNPYVMSKAVGVLRGHASSVSAVRFLLAKRQLLSYSKDKVLQLWDVSSQLCIHRLAGVFPRTPEHTHTLMFLHEERARLLLSFNSLLVVLEAQREDEGRRRTSHEHAVTWVLHNSLFRQVISCDTNSSVIFWLISTGQKVKHFHRCHGNAEISTMALDGTQTRLFTAGTDGVVKVWDFNGHCHHKLNTGRGQAVEISQILALKRTVLFMGWERMITVFRLQSFSQFFVEPSEWKGGVQHQDHVLCAAFRPPQTLVTGSYDGQITVWNNSTENALRKLRPHAWGEQSKTPTEASGSGDFEEDWQGSNTVSRVFFLHGRKAATTTAGGPADLVSCGGSGLVRFWNTAQSRLVAEFTAHRDTGSIVMAISPCGRYLVSGDTEGTLNTWDIQDYCVQPGVAVTNEAPELLSSLRPHLDAVTHLEICIHGDSLLLLSSSADSCVVLSYLPGETIGVFGQEEHWHLGGPGPTLPGPGLGRGSCGDHESGQGTASPQSPKENPPYPGFHHHEGEGETKQKVGKEDEEEERGGERGEPTSSFYGNPANGSSILGRCYDERRGQWATDSKLGHREMLLRTEAGTFNGLHMEELQSVGQLSRPDFVTHPHLYFNQREEPLPTHSGPPSREAVKAAFDERSLFPKDLLQAEQRLRHRGAPDLAEMGRGRRRESRSHGRGRRDRPPKVAVATLGK